MSMWLLITGLPRLSSKKVARRYNAPPLVACT